MNAKALILDRVTVDQARYAAHADTCDRVLEVLATSRHGLSQAEAAVRLEHYGANALPRARPPGVLRVFAHQFASPRILT